jgi:hypothetical protein
LRDAAGCLPGWDRIGSADVVAPPAWRAPAARDVDVDDDGDGDGERCNSDGDCEQCTSDGDGFV